MKLEHRPRADIGHDPDLACLIEADFESFTSRERQILRMRASGYGVTEIARKLKTYRNEIYRVIWKAQAHLSQSLHE